MEDDVSLVLRSGTHIGAGAFAPAMLATQPSDFGVVIRAATHGKGAFATRPIPAWRALGSYGGELLTQAQYDARYPDGDAQYVLQLAADVYRDAVDPAQSNWLRYLNDPRGLFKASGARATANCQYERGGVVRTTRRIAPGEELLVSYGRYYKFKAAAE
jgi:SET domain-containing protein